MHHTLFQTYYNASPTEYSVVRSLKLSDIPGQFQCYYTIAAVFFIFLLSCHCQWSEESQLWT